METTQKRQQLHEYIESVDDDKVDALFLILKSGNYKDYAYSEKDINMFNERKEQYENGKGKNLSSEEFFNEIRKSQQ